MGGVRRALALVSLGAALGIAAAGCGGGSSNDSSTPSADESFSTYETQMQNLGQSLAAALADAGTANRTGTPRQIEVNLRKTQRTLRRTANQLARITPPEDAKAGHALLIKGVREYADEIDGLITKVRKGNKNVVFLVTNLKGVKDMTKATREISKQGYIIVLGG